MAQVNTGQIYTCFTHPQEGHELAGNHPVVVIARQDLIDRTGMAIVVPLTSTPPHRHVHWSVRIDQTDSYAYIRHIKTVSVAKLNQLIGEADPDEIDSIRDSLSREFAYYAHEPVIVEGQRVSPGSLWSALVPNPQGPTYQTNLLVLTSNHDTGLVTALTIDSMPRGHPRQSILVHLEDPVETGYAITYQVRSISAFDRLQMFRGQIPDTHIPLARSYLLRHIGY